MLVPVANDGNPEYTTENFRHLLIDLCECCMATYKAWWFQIRPKNHVWDKQLLRWIQ